MNLATGDPPQAVIDADRLLPENGPAVSSPAGHFIRSRSVRHCGNWRPADFLAAGRAFGD